MRNQQISPTYVLVLLLSTQCLATEFVPSEARRQAFLRALEQQDKNYDPNERMLRAPFSSPGYHTTLKGGAVHRTRETLEYAVALLDSGEPERLKRAEAILRRVIALQDQDPNSRTYGIWSWFLEEPLDKMSPPDWNWADFCATQLLQVALDHANRLAPDLEQKVQNAILHAALSIQRRNVGPGYTNIALMGTYVTLVAGERLDVPGLCGYGKQRLRRFYDYTKEKGSFSEYNSPTYTCVAIEEISRMRQHVRDAESQELLGELNEFAWRHIARRFHPPTGQWSGPHSRAYSTFLRTSTLAFIQRATGGQVRFGPESEAWESIDAHRVKLNCPPDLYHYFTTLTEPRVEIETFEKNPPTEHDIIGTTYLHPAFTLASVNIGDLWNQRRPLLAYWDTPKGPASLRLRCLHDGYDYASASLFTVQDKGDILGAVVFATDRGDAHISLDKIKDATIKAKDLRLRLQFEGTLDDLALPTLVFPTQAGTEKPIEFTSGSIEGTLSFPWAVFEDTPAAIETGKESGSTWVDVIFYHGTERKIDFRKVKTAGALFALSMSTRDDPSREIKSMATLKVRDGRIGNDVPVPERRTAQWERPDKPSLTLSIPTVPLGTWGQRRQCAAWLGPTNPWKATSQ